VKLLFVGGTSFVGRHAVETAVARGHDVSVFHRGQTNPRLLAGTVMHRTGDRTTGDYSSLDDATSWDAVVDVSAYFPRAVNQLCDAIGERTAHYVHISTISAYDEACLSTAEDSPLHDDLADPTFEGVTAATYGPLKAMCERAALQRFGDTRTAIIRPTFVCGPHDPMDRFTYWVRRMARGGDVAIVAPETPVQIIDARDLGNFTVSCAETAATGALDAVGPFAPLNEFLATITPEGVTAHLVDVGRKALDALDVNLPLVLGEGEPFEFMTRPGARARAAGLTTRSLQETAEATRAWDLERGEPTLRVGLSPDVETRLLAGDWS
jgi:2'-hydroxyisoflavone reductase